MAKDKKSSTSNLSVQEAARRITERKNKVMQIVDDATRGSKGKAKKEGARKKQAPSVAEIKKSKHKGLEGETSYGQRMNEPAVSNTKTRFGQSGNSNGGDY